MTEHNKTILEQLIGVYAAGGFRLTKWMLSSRTVLQSVPGSELAGAVRDLDFNQDSLPVERTLGVQWSVETDTFGFRIIAKDKPITRRGIISLVFSIYDPLAFAAPFILPAKMILQDLCRLKIGWDDTIPEIHEFRWRRWLAELPKLAQFAAPRCLKLQACGEVTSSQIHHFSDANETGYGSVAFLCQVDSNGQVHCSFLIGKSRVAPLKQIRSEVLDHSWCYCCEESR